MLDAHHAAQGEGAPPRPESVDNSGGAQTTKKGTKGVSAFIFFVSCLLESALTSICRSHQEKTSFTNLGLI
jgi:hypothetical protein